MVAVDIEGFQFTVRRRARLHPVCALLDLRAHQRQRVGEAHVALNAVAAHALDAYRPATDRARSEKI